MINAGGFTSCIRTDQATKLAHYYYTYNKYTDLIETMIFVLRKKENQVSFLHVYHHVAIILGSTFALNYGPGKF